MSTTEDIIVVTDKVQAILARLSDCLPTLEVTRVIALNDFPEEPRWHNNLVLLLEIRPELVDFLDNYEDAFAEDMEILADLEKLTDERLAYVGDCYTNERNTRGVTHFLLSQNEIDQDVVMAVLAKAKKFSGQRAEILREFTHPV